MILNLTQHSASDEQCAAGVVDMDADERTTLVDLLTFESLPEPSDVQSRAQAIAELAALADVSGASEEDQNAGVDRRATAAMIGGAPFLMAPLAQALHEQGIRPLFAFSRRESVETTVDGSVHKTSVFRHLGFVPG